MLRVLSLSPPVPLFPLHRRANRHNRQPRDGSHSGPAARTAPQARAQLQTLPPSVTDLSAPAGAARRGGRGRASGGRRWTRHTQVLCLSWPHTEFGWSQVRRCFRTHAFCPTSGPARGGQLERSSKPWLESSIEEKKTGRAASDWLVATTGRRLWRFVDVFAERNA